MMQKLKNTFEEKNGNGSSSISGFNFFKGSLFGLRQFWANERPFKVMETAFYFTSSFRSEDI